MSEMEKMLNGLSETGGTLGSGSAEEHIVVGRDRIIRVPDSLKKIAVQYDHNVETVTFDCPRLWDDIDLSELKVKIAYLRADGELGGGYATNIQVDDTDNSIMHFDWTIKKHATMIKGHLAIMVCISSVDDEGNEIHHWNSEVNKDDIYIAEGLECNQTTLLAYPDEIEKLLIRMSDLEAIGLSYTINVKETSRGYTLELKDSTGITNVEILHGAEGPEGKIIDKNSGKVFNVFIGTEEEWSNYEGDKEGLLFLPVYDNIEVDKAKEADHAAKADHADFASESDYAVEAELAKNAINANKLGNKTLDSLFPSKYDWMNTTSKLHATVELNKVDNNNTYIPVYIPFAPGGKIPHKIYIARTLGMTSASFPESSHSKKRASLLIELEGMDLSYNGTPSSVKTTYAAQGYSLSCLKIESAGNEKTGVIAWLRAGSSDKTNYVIYSEHLLGEDVQVCYEETTIGKNTVKPVIIDEAVARASNLYNKGIISLNSPTSSDRYLGKVTEATKIDGVDVNFREADNVVTFSTTKSDIEDGEEVVITTLNGSETDIPLPADGKTVVKCTATDIMVGKIYYYYEGKTMKAISVYSENYSIIDSDSYLANIDPTSYVNVTLYSTNEPIKTNTNEVPVAKAILAETAWNAEESNHASTATEAEHAAKATEAEHAENADYSNEAGHASSADTIAVNNITIEYDDVFKEMVFKDGKGNSIPVSMAKGLSNPSSTTVDLINSACGPVFSNGDPYTVDLEYSIKDGDDLEITIGAMLDGYSNPCTFKFRGFVSGRESSKTPLIWLEPVCMYNVNTYTTRTLVTLNLDVKTILNNNLVEKIIFYPIASFNSAEMKDVKYYSIQSIKRTRSN